MRGSSQFTLATPTVSTQRIGPVIISLRHRHLKLIDRVDGTSNVIFDASTTSYTAGHLQDLRAHVIARSQLSNHTELTSPSGVAIGHLVVTAKVEENNAMRLITQVQGRLEGLKSGPTALSDAPTLDGLQTPAVAVDAWDALHTNLEAVGPLFSVVSRLSEVRNVENGSSG